MNSSHHSLLSDQPFLVALKFLRAAALGPPLSARFLDSIEWGYARPYPMGTSYALFRLKAPLGRRRKLDLDADTRRFGPQVLRRLAAIEGASVEGKLLRLQQGGVDIELDVDRRCIIGNHIGPWDLLPVAEALQRDRPLAIFDLQTSTWHAPEKFAAKAPRRRPPIYIAEPLRAGEGTTLQHRWTVRATGEYWSPRTMFTSSDGALVLSGWEAVTALDSQTGATRWALTTGRNVVEIALVGDLVVCASLQPDLFGVDARSGGTRWRLPLAAYATCLRSAGQHQVAVGTAAGEVMLVDGQRGVIVWQASVPIAEPRSDRGQIFCLAADPRHVLAGTNLGASVCFDIRTGKALGASPPHTCGRMWEFIRGFLIIGDEVVVREAYHISAMRLPGLTERQRFAAGLVRAHGEVFGASDEYLVEGSVELPASEHHDREYVGRVFRWPSLEIVSAAEVPDGTSAPLRVGNRWISVLKHEKRPQEFLVGVFDHHLHVLMEAAWLPGTGRDAQVAVARDVLFVCHKDRVTAFALP